MKFILDNKNTSPKHLTAHLPPLALILNNSICTVVEKKTILGCAEVVLKEGLFEHWVMLRDSGIYYLN